MALRLTRIDELTRGDHWYLQEPDDCYYLGEYTARRGFAFSETNQLIANFKKPVNRRGQPDWKYKGSAIQRAGSAFRGALPEGWLERATLVPVPPSKAQDDPLYDDRMLQMLTVATQGLQGDVRELVSQLQSTEAAHLSNVRPTPADLIANYAIEEAAANARPAPEVIGVFDDLLTTGCHFIAMKAVLEARFPGIPILGFFIARRVPESDFAAIGGE